MEGLSEKARQARLAEARVLVVDDYVHTWRLLRFQLRKYVVVQEAGSFDEALALCEEQMPDVTLIDRRRTPALQFGCSGEVLAHLSLEELPPRLWGRVARAGRGHARLRSALLATRPEPGHSGVGLWLSSMKSKFRNVKL